MPPRKPRNYSFTQKKHAHSALIDCHPQQHHKQAQLISILGHHQQYWSLFFRYMNRFAKGRILSLYPFEQLYKSNIPSPNVITNNDHFLCGKTDFHCFHITIPMIRPWSINVNMGSKPSRNHLTTKQRNLLHIQFAINHPTQIVTVKVITD